MCRFADDHTVGRRHRLHPARRVDDVAGDGLSDLRSGAEADDRLAGVHGDPHRDGGIVPTKVRDRAEHGERRADRALGIVLVRHRRAEHAHDRVSDELVEGSSEPLDVQLHARVEGHQGAPDVLGVRLVRSFREPDEIDEEDRDDPPLLRGHGTRRDRRERDPAVRAESRPVGALGAAGRAGSHPPESRDAPAHVGPLAGAVTGRRARGSRTC